jgi:hypothetical protein
MTRFFAHLCLYLQMIDITVSPLAIQIILEAYLQVLEARPYHTPFSQLVLTGCVDRAQVSVLSSPCMLACLATTPSSATRSS